MTSSRDVVGKTPFPWTLFNFWFEDSFHISNLSVKPIVPNWDKAWDFYKNNSNAERTETRLFLYLHRKIVSRKNCWWIIFDVRLHSFGETKGQSIYF